MPHHKNKGERKRVMSGSPDLPKTKGSKLKKSDTLSDVMLEEAQEDEDSSNDDQSSVIEEMVSAKMKEIEALRAQKTKRTKKLSAFSPKDRDAEASTVQRIIRELTPMLVAVITESVAAAVQKEMSNLTKQLKEENSTTAQYAQQQVLHMHYEKDRLEQYGRKDSVRISGVVENEGEKVEEVIKKIAEAAGMEMEIKDVSACHRLGRRGERPRNIICRFVSRQTKSELMKKRKELKGKAGFERVFINDDLTHMRQKLFAIVRQCDGVSRANTKDGKIYCNMRGSSPSDRPIIVETPDDLHKLGINLIPFRDLGLEHLLLPNA